MLVANGIYLYDNGCNEEPQPICPDWLCAKRNLTASRGVLSLYFAGKHLARKHLVGNKGQKRRKVVHLTLQSSDLELNNFELTEFGAKRPNPRMNNTWFPWRVLLIALLLVAISLFPWGWSKWVKWRYAPVTYSATEYQEAYQQANQPMPPSPRVAIVFGARVYSRERLSAMLRDRVDTAVDLYHADKVDKLLLSGGQNGLEYDEPTAMMAYALERGVPAEAMQPDYGGRRTYDSCYRAANIFQVQQAVLITQEFHLPRALLLCDNLGIEVVGVKADRRIYDPRSIAFSEAREIPALLAALVDLVRRPLPPILGEPIPIE